ncbi:MAG: elongation factor 4, partial [Candidatus Nealsonbacteria bacterium CG08_land_8_20_14_0_20_36_22]
LKKLKLNDPSLFFEPETKEALGRGFRCGFLGTLHAEIISERLYREFGPNLVISPASVVYKVDGKLIYSAVDWPQSCGLTEELWASLEIITPTRYLGKVLEILKNFQGNYLNTEYIGSEKAILFYEVSLRAIIENLYDKIKSVSQGYASMSYKILGFRKGDLVKMEVLVAGEKKEALSKIVLRDQVFCQGKKLVEKLKEVLPSQQFSIALQAVVGGRIVARETIRARRKDVTGYLYGGDYTRKRKLLEKQKKGKKILKVKGKVIIPSKAYLEIFRG